MAPAQESRGMLSLSTLVKGTVAWYGGFFNHLNLSKVMFCTAQRAEQVKYKYFQHLFYPKLAEIGPFLMLFS
jgi:hypothetical protein